MRGVECGEKLWSLEKALKEVHLNIKHNVDNIDGNNAK